MILEIARAFSAGEAGLTNMWPSTEAPPLMLGRPDRWTVAGAGDRGKPILLSSSQSRSAWCGVCSRLTDRDAVTIPTKGRTHGHRDLGCSDHDGSGASRAA